ncbi:NAD-dependent epimerase/dehydratase family protein [Sanguibacter suaedae]|uniref:NAD(P)-dependent oxidoreductase n=1 Tax=Sanguibacter suaedae TaxID=2795737 RepID=A0A934I1E9_9MICO|nr:NAD(P)-dependent oxidoreductase [Sanguibacter suaedae]MBI9113809.1 NAD(P)-dependent oxidoreductase [Sanguibacter suaedae]
MTRTGTTAGTPTTVLVVGASGFIGSHVVRGLAQHPGVRVVASSRTAPTEPLPATVEHRTADLCDEASLRAALEGVDVVVHAVSYVGRDAGTSRAVNVDGTRALMEAASARGVGRVVYVSTTSVYGSGPHRDVAEDDVPAHPESVASTDRLAAERLVLDAHGTVVRPNLVYGAGDRWFVPALAQVTAGLGATIAGASARISLASVEQVAAVVAAAALGKGLAGRVLHAVAPEATPVRVVLDALTAHLGVPGPSRDLTEDEARAVLDPQRVSDHQLALLARDHAYDGSQAWAAVDAAGTAGDAHREAFALTDVHVAWYRAALGSA